MENLNPALIFSKILEFEFKIQEIMKICRTSAKRGEGGVWKIIDKKSLFIVGFLVQNDAGYE